MNTDSADFPPKKIAPTVPPTTESAENQLVTGNQEAQGRCNPSQNLAIEYMVSRIASLEWKLRQERAKVRELEQRLADIAAIDGGVL